VEQLNDLLAERLTDVRRQAIENHVEACAACQDRLRRCAAESAGPQQPTPRAADADSLPSDLLRRLQDDPQGCNGAEPSAQRPLPRVPGYDILHELGRGGMGVVYLARHLGLKRLVAVKMILSGDHASDAEREGLRREALAAARLNHPHLVQVYDVGEAEGRTFLAMEFVAGGSLAGHLLGRPLPPPAAATLTETLARAVQVAHRQGVVHRDLKPANVLLASGGRQPPEGTHSEGLRPPLAELVPKIADFGLAKRLDAGDGATPSGVVLGTPSYMAPEQAGGRSGGTGPAADIYSLGAILYECLTGRPPFIGATLLDTLEQVVHAEPVPPSRLQPGVPVDLETICLKCLHKEPARRYASADELADDLGRCRRGEPIKARPVGAAARLLRWCRRNKTVAALSGGVGLLLLALAIGSTVAAVLYRSALTDKSQALDRAETEKANAQAAEAKALAAKVAAEESDRLGKAQLWLAHRARVQAARNSHLPGQRFDSLDAIREALKLPVPEGHSIDELRTEAIGCLVLPDIRRLPDRVDWRWTQGVQHASVDPDSETCAGVTRSGEVFVVRQRDGTVLHRLPPWEEEPLRAGRPCWAFLNRGGTLLLVYDQGISHFRVWKLSSAGFRLLADHRRYGPLVGAPTNPFENWLALATRGGTVLVFDPEADAVREVPQPEGVTGVSVHAASRRLALTRSVGGGEEAVRHELLIQLLDGAAPATYQLPEPVSCPTWHPGGKRLVLAGQSFRLYLIDLSTGVRRVLEGIRNGGIDMNCSEDLLVSSGWDAVIRLWDPRTGRLVLTLPGGLQPRWDRTGRILTLPASGPQMDQAVPYVRYEVASGREYRTLVSDADPIWLGRPSLHHGGRLLAVGMKDGIRFWDLGSGDQVGHIKGLGWTPSVHFTGRGDELVSHGRTGLNVWRVSLDPASGLCRVDFGSHLADPPQGDFRHAMSRDGTILAVPGFTEVTLHKRGTRLTSARLGAYRDIRRVEISPDGKWLIPLSHQDFTDSTDLWHTAAQTKVRKLVDGPCVSGCFSPDGRWLALGDGHVYKVGTWEQLHLMPGFSAAFTSDGETLAVTDQTVIRLIHPESGREWVRFDDPNQDRLYEAIFSPDDSLLIVPGGESQTIRVWNLGLIRRQLRDLNLDWGAPPVPDTSDAAAGPPLDLSLPFDGWRVPLP
jgi:WD40 repeat protein